jgi:D-alanyl-D-alanine carboxypeptidase (penicillin-binding protein 5/6)
MTAAAGWCLAASAQRDDLELYSVVLGAASDHERFQESEDLLEFGFKHYSKRTLMEADTLLGEAEVVDYIDTALLAGVASTVEASYFDLKGSIEHSAQISDVQSPVEEGDVVGFVTFTQDGEFLTREPIVAFESIEEPTFFQRVGISLTRFWRWITNYNG